MVSGFLTSPYDHERILSGEARLILMASNSEASSCFFTPALRLNSDILRSIPEAAEDMLSIKFKPSSLFCISLILTKKLLQAPRITGEHLTCYCLLVSGMVFLFSISISIPRERISLINTLNDSGIVTSIV